MAEKDPQTQTKTDAEVIEEADRLYEACKPLELYEFLLQHKDSNNEEVLWRLCRAIRDVAQMNSTLAARKKELTYEALEHAKRCLEINEQNYASHKWFAICISEVGDFEGTKKKISNAYVIRDHFQKAIDLNPMDATSRHLMGLWCFTFAEMPWYQRKIAAVIFGSPPTSTYEEALEHFKKGEEISPGFYSKNLLMLGRTYLKVNDKEQARVYLNKLLEYDCKKDEDKRALGEAKQHLKGL
ncbi:regulator of microtubule dynamics protein 1-like isoform X2 [Acanthaster planci]|nr:regulator of microtubule dynamics protein 1-like isoform X2 [Acanthaster planci]XP_022110924.1 regulator of microtubule dynamics protein 1-like isoform X2 [Acanthaster planci]